MKKLFCITSFSLGIALPLISFNLIISKSDPNHVFPLIFICLGLCNTTIGIHLLNANKKILSISSFILAGFIFILVGSKICISN